MTSKLSFGWWRDMYRPGLCFSFFVFLTFYFDSDTYPVPIEQARCRLFHVRFKSYFRLAGEYSINCLIHGRVVVVFDVVEFTCDTTGFGRRRHAKKASLCQALLNTCSVH